jgi:hypothetical protein
MAITRIIDYVWTDTGPLRVEFCIFFAMSYLNKIFNFLSIGLYVSH